MSEISYTLSDKDIRNLLLKFYKNLFAHEGVYDFSGGALPGAIEETMADLDNAIPFGGQPNMLGLQE